MTDRLKIKKYAMRTALYLFLALLAVILLFPYGFMINRSFMSNDYVRSPVMHYFPDGLHFRNFVSAFADGGYGMPLMYSGIVCVLVAITVPLSSLLSAYAFSKLEFIGKKFMFAFMMLTALLPGIVTQVPMYVLYNNLGMTNTLFPLFLPGVFFAGAMNVFLARQFLLSLPKALEESAKIEGANALQRCFIISAPLCFPILIYLGVNSFMAAWGDYLTPSMYINSSTAPYTLAYALYKMTSTETNAQHPEWIFAAATIASVVPTILYAAFQKYLVEGIAAAGLKG